MKIDYFSLVGHRVNQIYDIDNKTYLIRLHNNDERTVLLLESGTRIQATVFDWPKSNAPSGFTMKLRKHLKNKRLENIEQLGSDRIIDLQFGTGEAAYHVILELYDRGNILLCDNEYMILNVLRPHTEGEELRFAVREKYPQGRARYTDDQPDMGLLKEKLKEASPGDTIRTILNPHLPFGASLIDHCLIEHGLDQCKIGGEAKQPENEGDAAQDGQKKKKKKKNRSKEGNQNYRDFNMDDDMPALMNAINDMYTMMKNAREQVSHGYLIQKKELKPTQDGTDEYYFANIEFQPYLYNQYKNEPVKEFPTFLQAVDEFYSSIESQRIDLKSFQQERDALKKLSNVRNDLAHRIDELSKAQKVDRYRAELITRNQVLVDTTIYAMRSLISKQMSWTEIKNLLKERQEQSDPIATRIRKLKLESNQISMYLEDPYQTFDDDTDNSELEEDEDKLVPMVIDIDLSLGAYSNATRYYDNKRTAARKELKTIEASGKALKSAERKTKQTLKDVKIQTTISKARKTYWFEKFFWFISSENFLIIGGRDQQQNELIVKRYMREKDIYVHAEIQGASSIIIKNPSGGEIPPKTLLEAGTMAISYSVAWDAKVVTSAYWVNSDQVSKTAPTGEYLSTGSFMIRGKKNFLPPCHLILGLSFLFKLEDSSVERHRGERRVRKFDDDAASVITTENEQLESIDEEEIAIASGSDSDDDENKDVLAEGQTDKVNDKESSSNSSEKEEEEEATEFPDTQIRIEHKTGKVDIQQDPKLERMLSGSNQDIEEEEATLIQAAPLKVKAMERQLKQKKKVKQQPKEVPSSEKDDKNGSKRGQKFKLKKIKEKYKDQDDDERAMAMEILKSSGSGKDSRKTKKQEEEEGFKKSSARNPQPKQKQAEDVDDTPVADEVDMLDALTGAPVDEDELLFAVPVVAPYQTLHNYK